MKSPIKPLKKQPAWKSLGTHYKEIQDWHLRDLFADDAHRGERLTAEAVGIYLDYSKNRITDETLKLLVQLAEECGLSVAHFARAFRQSLKTSPHRWLLERRIERAMAMLSREQASLADIALACGFSDQSHFTRVFAKHAGVSPGQWRRENVSRALR